jgi:hypothetical protein
MKTPLLVLLAVPALQAQSFAPPTGTEFTIAWTGDPHYGSSTGTTQFSLPPIATWLIANKTTWNIKAFASVGDNVCRAQTSQISSDACFIAVGGYTPLTTFATALDNASIPYVIINGNHDCSSSSSVGTSQHVVWDTVSLPRTHFAWNSVFPAGKFRNQYLKIDSGATHLGILGLTSDDTPADSDCETPDLTTVYNIQAASWSGGVATVTLPHLFGILTGSTVSITGAGAYNAAGVVAAAINPDTLSYPLAANPGGSCASNCGTLTSQGTALRKWAQGIIDTDTTRQFMTVMHQTPGSASPQPGVSGTLAGPYTIAAGVNDKLSVTVQYPVNALSWTGGTATASMTAYQEFPVGQTVTVAGSSGFTAYNATTAVTAATTSTIGYALANPSVTCGAACGTASATTVITLTPGTRTAAQVAADIGAALGLQARVQVHPTRQSVRIGATSTPGTIILNTVANSAYASLGLVGQTAIVDKIAHLNWSTYGAYTPCAAEIAGCSRDGNAMWTGFISPNPRILWALSGHDQTQASLWAQPNSAGSTVFMPMGGEYAIFLMKFQPALNQVTTYLVDMTLNSGAGGLMVSPWYYSPEGVGSSVVVTSWTPILPIPSSAVSGAVTIRGGTVH